MPVMPHKSRSRCNVDYICFPYLVHLSQLKYLEREEFWDLRRLTHIRLDGNRLSVVIDHLFERQKNLRFIGTLWSVGVGCSGRFNRYNPMCACGDFDVISIQICPVTCWPR